MEKDYNSNSLDSLEHLEAVRKRPGMYIGSTSQRGVNHILFEVVDNVIDEFVVGYGKRVNVTINKDCSVTIIDEARGIPVGPHHKWRNPDGTPMNSLTGALTILHAGGKFDDSNYKYSIGLHGVGMKATNALSTWFKVTVKHDDKIHSQEFSIGVPTTDVLEVSNDDRFESKTGTIIEYLPDNTIFKSTIEPSCSELRTRFKELATLNAGFEIHYRNEITNVVETFVSTTGITGYVLDSIHDKNTLLYDQPMYHKYEYIDGDNVILVEFAFSYVDIENSVERIKTFANNVNTYDGGFHLSGFRNGLKNQLNKFGIDKKIIQDPIELQYLINGINAVISVKLSNVELEGQTKTKLGNSEAQTAVEAAVINFFETLSKEQQNSINVIVNHGLQVKLAEEAARKARLQSRKLGKIARISLPGKLADCASRNGYSEIFICEGDSASGTAKSARYREFQAILPLRGKILNVEKTDLDRMISSETIQNMIAAFGTGVGKEFNLEKLRYDKIVIMTDADVDGSHICTLILTFLYRYMNPLFENKKVYVAQSPLYRGIKNKVVTYLKDDYAMKQYLKKNPTAVISRFKGLGEMSYSELKYTTMDPKTRTLKLITVLDAEEAVATFNMLMGNDASLRRDFFEENAHLVDVDNI